MSRVRIFMVCSGLGHVLRGFESFFQDCYGALSDEKGIDLHLFKGGGETVGGETRLRNLRRNDRLAVILGALMGRSGYFIEQLTFFISLFPYIAKERPHVIYVADVVLGNLLRLSRWFWHFRIILHNGGPTSTEFLGRWEHIHQLSPEHMDVAVKEGVSESKQTLLPCGVTIPARLARSTPEEQSLLRRKLNLPTDRKLILSVGAINTSRKRMDYLIREVASMPEPRPYLLLLGAQEAESEVLLRMGRNLLPDGFDGRSVNKSQVADYYLAADLFTLVSMDEGFGLSYVEALAHGLPCLAHDYPTARFVLGQMGMYGDLSKDGALSTMIAGLTPADFADEKAMARHAWAYEQFSWDRLRPKYIEMFLRCARR